MPETGFMPYDMPTPQGTTKRYASIRSGRLYEDPLKSDIINKSLIGIDIQTNPSGDAQILCACHTLQLLPPRYRNFFEDALGGPRHGRVVLIRKVCTAVTGRLRQLDLGKKHLSIALVPPAEHTLCAADNCEGPLPHPLP